MARATAEFRPSARTIVVTRTEKAMAAAKATIPYVAAGRSKAERSDGDDDRHHTVTERL
jgi:hypothetical protein